MNKMSNATILLKKMPNIAGHVHYQASTGDHLYVSEKATKKPGRYATEFEILYDDWPKYFSMISRSEQTEQDFEEDKEAEKDLAEIRKEQKMIEQKLQNHGEECPQFKRFMDYAYHSFPNKDGNGFISLTPLIRDFDSCPYCRTSLEE
jgi:hypothetical protein